MLFCDPRDCIMPTSVFFIHILVQSRKSFCGGAATIDLTNNGEVWITGMNKAQMAQNKWDR